MKSKLIVIEGMDGSGKATQAKMLKEAMEYRLIDVTSYDFPSYKAYQCQLVEHYLGKDFMYENLNNPNKDEMSYARGVSLFYTMDRFISNNTTKPISKDLAEGKCVICDRYTTSNIMHQTTSMTMTEVKDYCKWINDVEYNLLKLPKPDEVLILYIEPEASFNNILNRYNGDKSRLDKHENLDHLRAVASKQLTLATLNGWKIIKCCEDHKMLSKDAIHMKILEALNLDYPF